MLKNIPQKDRVKMMQMSRSTKTENVNQFTTQIGLHAHMYISWAWACEETFALCKA